MSSTDERDRQLEIAHVLFIDIVGYSRLLIDRQRELLQQLNRVVRATEQFRNAEAAEKLIRLPTGDGMALVFLTSPDAPVRCALEVSLALKSYPQLKVRMGINSGPVDAVSDVNDRSNVAGAGINTARRVMDCGDAGHILLSKRVADDLGQYEKWQPLLHYLGAVEVKHGVRIEVVNLYTEELGNPKLPENLKPVTQEPRAPEVVPFAAITGPSKLLLLATVLLAIALAVGFGFWVVARRAAPKSTNASAGNASGVVTTIPEKSIAVLPLENLSEDKDNAFFADGIQDDVLCSLAKIKELKVISRSSVMGYRNPITRNLREIGQQLGVANILEGSVRRVANRVLVNVNLVDTRNDRQVWAERYERTLADSLTLQGELATEIAAALRATISPEEKARVGSKPTNNADAYLLYLRAREYQTRPTGLLQDYETAERLYTKALALDPGFALAHARLSITLAYTYQNFQPTEEIKKRARAEAEEALRLQSDLGEGRLAHGLCLYWTEKNYDAALHELELAARLLPNDAEIDLFESAIRRRQGQWSAAIAGMERASARDPRNALLAREVLLTEWMVRDWAAAARGGDRAVALAPDLPLLRVERSYVDIWSRNDLAPLRAALNAVPVGLDPDGEVTLARWDAALLARDFTAAERAVAALASESALTPFGTPLPKAYLLGCIDLARGEPQRAQPLFESARTATEAEARAFPLDAFRQAQLGLLYACLGRKEEALRQGRRAVELLPESKDAFYGPTLSALLALICARTGESDQAIALIERLLTVPGPVRQVFEGSMTLTDLRLRWQWDPLRSDPRFQKIIAGPEPKTIYK
jgi:TolB-like protein/class 3 adenylate cyclase